MKDNFWPLSPVITSGDSFQTIYDLFGMIAIEGKTTESMTYVSIIKKRDDNEWYVFRAGSYHKITEKQALTSFFP